LLPLIFLKKISKFFQKTSYNKKIQEYILEVDWMKLFHVLIRQNEFFEGLFELKSIVIEGNKRLRTKSGSYLMNLTSSMQVAVACSPSPFWSSSFPFLLSSRPLGSSFS